MAGIRGFVGQLHPPPLVRACPPHFMSSARCMLVNDYGFRIADSIPFSILGFLLLTPILSYWVHVCILGLRSNTRDHESLVVRRLGWIVFIQITDAWEMVGKLMGMLRDVAGNLYLTFGWCPDAVTGCVLF